MTKDMYNTDSKKYEKHRPSEKINNANQFTATKIDWIWIKQNDVILFLNAHHSRIYRECKLFI